MSIESSLQPIQARFTREPSRITTTVVTGDAVNGYGFIQHYECQVELVRSHCQWCKRLKRRGMEEFCPAGNYHKFISGFVRCASGAGLSYEEAVEKALEELSKQVGE